MEVNGVELPAVQHLWVVKANAIIDNKLIVEGVIDTTVYE